MKKCNTCNEIKDLELFAKGKEYKDGRRNICKQCHSAYQSRYFKDNPDKRQPNRLYEKHYLRHRLTEKQWAFMLNRYDGKCWVCKVRPITCVDHDHSCCPGSRSCGKCVRGALCSSCNAAIGSLGDSVDGVRNAMVYLEQYNLSGLPLAM